MRKLHHCKITVSFANSQFIFYKILLSSPIVNTLELHHVLYEFLKVNFVYKYNALMFNTWNH